MIPQPQRTIPIKHTTSHLYSPLKYQRLLRGWSQRDVASALLDLCVTDGKTSAGINADMVGRWENGRCKPSPFYLQRLCRLYNLTTAQLGFLETVTHPEEVQP